MRFPIATYICIGLFLVSSIIQLVLAFGEKQELRKKEKFCCMLFLGTAVVLAFPNEPLIYIGAFLGMVGDILVLRKSTFVPGTIAFFIGHICYILETIWKIIGFVHIPLINYIIFGFTYIVIALFVFQTCNKSKNHTAVDVIGQSLYFAILITYIPVFAFATFYVGGFMYLSLIGSVIFIISDSILVVTHFGNKFKRYDFYIMLTYLLAEFLIISGFALTLALK